MVMTVRFFFVMVMRKKNSVILIRMTFFWEGGYRNEKEMYFVVQYHTIVITFFVMVMRIRFVCVLQ